MDQKHLHDDPERVTAIGMARYAVEFMQAALAADDKLGARRGHEVVAPVPVMFLVGQAMELALKAFLLSRSLSPRDVRKLGHDLDALMASACDAGLLELVKLDADALSAIGVLNTLYATKELQYILTGAKVFPVFGPLEAAALRLLHAIGNEVGYPPRDLPQPVG